jgi:glycerol kinase
VHVLILLDRAQGHARTGLPLSTYFSAIKLRWMISHHEAVKKAHDEDDLLFGTVESWLTYVRGLSSWLGTFV